MEAKGDAGCVRDKSRGGAAQGAEQKAPVPKLSCSCVLMLMRQAADSACCSPQAAGQSRGHGIRRTWVVIFAAPFTNLEN